MELTLHDYAEKAVNFASSNGVQYCDARAEIQEKKSITIENGQIENTKNLKDEGIGIRFLKNGRWGFCSFSNPKSFEHISEQLKKNNKSDRLFI